MINRPVKLTVLKRLLRKANTEYLRIRDMEKEIDHYLSRNVTTVLMVDDLRHYAYKLVLDLQKQVDQHPRTKKQ